MSVLCKTRTASFEEVVRVVLTDSGLQGNKFLADFEKYDLLPAYWRLCEDYFDYTDSNPTLEKLVVTMFVTYTDRYIDTELPKAWKSFVSYKSGNIIAFLDNLMNSLLYRDRYNELSEIVATGLNAASTLESVNVEDLLRCDAFSFIDQMIIRWIVGRLLVEDTGAHLKGMTIPLICQERRKRHFGDIYKEQYHLMEHAYFLILQAKYHCPEDFKGLSANTAKLTILWIRIIDISTPISTNLRTMLHSSDCVI